jgi:DUF971 family protein
MSYRPTNITADRRERQLTIEWDDGHTSVYPFAGLRAVCPCAGCRGGHEFMGGPPDRGLVRDTPPGELTVQAIQPVGSYALQFIWSDGHSAGIYTWDFLRAACPCPLCLPEE